MEPQIQRVRDMFGQSGKARYISHEDDGDLALAGRDQRLFGRAELGRIGLPEMASGRRQYLVPPGTPMDGRVANEFQRLCRKDLERVRHDYTVMNVCSARFAGGLYVITFNREDEPLTSATAPTPAIGKCRKKSVRRGVFVGRAPVDYHGFHMRADHAGVSDALAAA